MDFTDLVKKISPVLKRITYRVNRNARYFGQDDLFQEALLRLWLDYQQGKLVDKTESYILQGCYFHLKNYLRTHYEKMDLVSLEGLAGGLEQEEPICLEEILHLENTYSLRDNIHCQMLINEINNNGLTSREKEVFNFSLEGLTCREIGQRMGISHVRVLKLAKNLREKCKKHLDLDSAV